MARRSIDTAFARAILSFDRGGLPPLWREAREDAEARARRLRKWLRLAPAEAAVFDRVVFDEVLYGAGPGEALSGALNEVDEFRAARRRLGDPPEMTVDFVDEPEWPEEWRRESRLLVLFEPVRSPEGFRLVPPDDLRALRQKLVMADGSATFLSLSILSQAQRVRATSFSRREGPFLWKGSQIRIFEGKMPEDSGRGPVETQTSVFARGELAAATYDSIIERLSFHEAASGEEETLWLAVALPDVNGSIPRSREVGPFGSVSDPVCIRRAASRLSLQIFRAPGSGFESEEGGAELICQWMAVEANA